MTASPGLQVSRRIGERDELVAAELDMEMVLVAEMLDPVDARRRSIHCRARSMRKCSVRAPTVLVPAGASLAGMSPAGNRLIARLAEPRGDIDAAAGRS